MKKTKRAIYLIATALGLYKKIPDSVFLFVIKKQIGSMGTISYNFICL
ncbi:hypothetical protein P9Z84_22860 [Bacillus cereus]|nr:hypothetical protein [Bacillus cereus]